MIKAKKSLGLPREARAKWGQNFLRDEKILRKIANFAQIEKEDIVVEIGPGEGTLTKILLEKAGRVIAVEKDRELAKQLEQNFREEILDNRLQIINEDVLNYESRIRNYVLVGNIPYYITGAVFRKFLQSPSAGGQPKSLTFVVQKEVAERIIATDGKESILSISIKVYGKPEYGGIIKAGSFSPRPKVDSAVISVRNIGKERFNELTPQPPLTSRGKPDTKHTEGRFFQTLKRGFAHKRKLLIRNLETKETGKLKEVFEKCGISEKARAEELKVEEWICLSREIST